MDTTLIVNPGSASKKYALYENGIRTFTARFERVGDGFVKCFEINGTREECEDIPPTAFSQSLVQLNELLGAHRGVTLSELTRIVVRVVAPGTYFQKHRILDEQYLSALSKMQKAAPLHIPPVIEEVKLLQKHAPRARIIAASDSAFHSTIPAHARTYSIPSVDTEKYDLYRFGYHGLSIASVMRRISQYLTHMPERVVVCHIGSGVSVTALRKGVSIDTSMGFTPGSGLMMGTRAGDIDPGALIYLLESKDLDDGEAHAFVQQQSGFKGLLGASDLRIALDRNRKGDPRAAEAVKMYFYGIQKQIGASIAALGGIDALVLTATAAERNPTVRSLLCEGLLGFGIAVDEEKNDHLVGKEGVLHAASSAVSILVLHTDEMGEMLRTAEHIQ